MALTPVLPESDSTSAAAAGTDRDVNVSRVVAMRMVEWKRLSCMCVASGWGPVVVSRGSSQAVGPRHHGQRPRLA